MLFDPSETLGSEYLTFAFIPGIGTSTSSGMAAACMNNSNSLPSPPSANQLLTKSHSLSNDTDNRDTSNCITTPNKPQLTNTIQKSPSDSLSSKNDTEKSRSTKSRNKEGNTMANWKSHWKSQQDFRWIYQICNIHVYDNRVLFLMIFTAILSWIWFNRFHSYLSFSSKLPTTSK